MINIKDCVVSYSKARSQNKVNVFHFCRMTKFDIKNYFEKIYNVDIAKVNTRIQLGECYHNWI